MLGGTVITVHGAGFDAGGVGDLASCSFTGALVDGATRDDKIDTIEAGASPNSMVRRAS